VRRATDAEKDEVWNSILIYMTINMMWSTFYYGFFSWTGQCFLSFSVEDARIKNVGTMETLQNCYFWEQFITVGTEMKSHQLSLILDIVNPLITVLR